MNSYTVHINPAATTEARQVVFAKDGFAWLALFAPIVWMIFHRMWKVLTAYIILLVALTFGLDFLSFNQTEVAIVANGFNIMIALQAGDLRAWELNNSGYETKAVVAAANEEEAEIRFFTDWQGVLPQPPEPTPSLTSKGPIWPLASKSVAPNQGPTAPASSHPTREGEVLGVFPDPSR
ncbi:MAG: DUF2628 domain-containing protein [Parvibaculaceae bacterium]|nr:DUF2628 domain-containing protein [Parvibaculaceae bacterium]